MTDYTPAEQGEIRADIETMYRSGRILLPERAEALAAVAERMTDVIGTVNSRSAQMGDHRVLIDVLDMAIDCQAGVARSVLSLNNLGAAVVAIADSFVARDEFAASVFNRLSDELRTGEPPQTPVPDAPNKDSVLNEGDGSEYEENPDVQPPDEEREDRDRELEDRQDNVPLPEA
ncbi:hypothetical protein [Allorhizocola rhizosphaerae]|uniref:hypothetical protein n=1 Tax=Allorhizocola rhizosphaerae TaxID=1872709 RepID=UPI000E3BAFF9|nr:hypothetical protein [Allorhizocola rhizosphaerae]